MLEYHLQPNGKQWFDFIRNYTIDSYHGFIADLGQTPIENINEQSREFIALTKHFPPTQSKNIKPEFTADGITFHKIVPINVGNTYILRAVLSKVGGGIFALKVYRKDPDGSIIIFVKTIKLIKPFERDETGNESIDTLQSNRSGYEWRF